MYVASTCMYTAIVYKVSFPPSLLSVCVLVISEPKFAYAQLDLSHSDEKPIIAKHEKTNYAQLVVEDSHGSLLPTDNGAAAGPTSEYVNYTPGQGLPPEKSAEASPVASAPPAMYTNLDYSAANGTVTVSSPAPAPPQAPPQVSYAQLDFSKSKSPERDGKGNSASLSRSISPGADGGSRERQQTGSVSSLGGPVAGGLVVTKGGKERTNYAQLDYNAMETVQHLPTREKVQRH